MAGLNIGSISISVVPSAVGFTDKLSAKLLPEADALGKEVGSRISAGVESALRDIGIKVDTTEADTKVEGLGAKLNEVSARDYTVNLGLDDTRIVTALEEISAKLDHLSASVYDVELELNAGTAVTRLDEISEKLDKVGARDATPKLGLDDSSFNRQLDEDMAKLNAAGAASASPGMGGGGSGGLIAGGILGGLAASPALPGALVGGGAAIGTLGAAFAGIMPALSAYSEAQKSAGQATTGTGAAASGAATQIHSAQQAVSAAETQASHDSITSSEAVRNAQAAVAQARAKAANDAITSAEQVRNAQAGVASAERQAANDAITSAEAIKNARLGVAAAEQQAANAQISAEQQLQGAEYSEQQAQISLTAARQQAVLTLQQLSNASADAVLNAEQARLSLEQARVTQQQVNATHTSTALQRAQADLNVQQAEQHLTESLQNRTNTADAAQKADKAGVAGSQAVLTAQHNLTQAHQGVADAQRNLTNVQTQGAASVAKAQQALADATRAASLRQQADAQGVAKAQQTLGDVVRASSLRQQADAQAIGKAQQALADATRAASWQQQADALGVGKAQYALNAAYGTSARGATAATTAAGKYAAALAALTPGGRAMVLAITGLEGSLKSLEGVSENAIAPGFVTFLQGVHALMPAISAEVGQMGSIIGSGLAAMGKAFQSSGFQQTLKSLFDEGNKFIQVVGPAVGNFIKAFLEMGARSAPAVAGLATGLVAIANGFADLFKQLSSSGTAAAVGSVLASLGKIIGALGAPLGALLAALMKGLAPVLTGLTPIIIDAANAMTAFLNAVPPSVLKVIAGTLIGLFVAMQVLALGPIGILITALAAVAIALYTAWEKSAAFRNIVKDIAVVFLGVGIDIVGAAKTIADGVLNFFGAIIHGAASAFGWIPGIGPKLKGAAAGFDSFHKGVDNVFDGITKTMQGWQDGLGASAHSSANLTKQIQGDFDKQAKAAQAAKGDVDKYTDAIINNGAGSDQAKAARAQLLQDMKDAGVKAPIAKRDVDDLTAAIVSNGTNSNQAKAARQQLITDILGASKNAKQGKTDLANLTAAVKDHGTTSDQYKTARKKLIDDLEAAGLNAQAAAKLVDGLSTSIKNVPASKSVTLTMTGAGAYTIQGHPVSFPSGPLQLATLTPGKHAAGALIPGYGGGDIVPALLEPGETVVPKHLTSAVAPLMKAHGVPGFQTGGLVTQGNTAVLGGTAPTQLYSDFQARFEQIIAAVGTAALAAAASGSGSAIAAYAKTFATGQGHPYVWGGTTPSGWDCSGYSSYIYHHFGYPAPRTSQQQQSWATPSADQPGALVFFYGRNGTASHVGISMGGGQYAGADSPAVGTIIHSDAGNTGFGIPPGGFKGAGAPGAAAAGGGTVAELARSMAAARGWTGAQWNALNAVEMKEAGWVLTAKNPSSGAYGIAQFINGPAEYAQYGGNANTASGQVTGLLNYVAQRYGTPEAALAHENAFGWYDGGGWMPPGMSLALNGTGSREAVLTGRQWDMISSAVTGGDGAGLGGRHVSRKLDRMIDLLERAPSRTAGGLGESLNGVARGAVQRAYTRTR